MEVIATIRQVKEEESLSDLLLKLKRKGIIKIRINLSKYQENRIKLSSVFRELKKFDRSNFTIMFDIPFPGYKPRIKINNISLEIKKNETYDFVYDGFNKISGIVIDSRVSFEELKVNQIIYYDSGKGILKIKKIDKESFKAVALNDFTLFNRKSISFGYIDKRSYRYYLEDILKEYVPDEMAFSFVQNESDLEDALKLKERYQFKIVSKIETELGYKNSDIIAELSDAIMLGRGDLGIWSENKKMLEIERNLKKTCDLYNCNYYIATDILNSMINNYIPSRGEIIDLLTIKEINPSAIILNVPLILSESIDRVLSYLKEIEIL